MTEIINNYKFSEELPTETEPMQNARRAALELAQSPISAALGQQLAIMVAASGAQNVVEIGTGTGLTGLWILAGNPSASLSSIDSDATNHDLARQAFAQGAPESNAQRLITGNPDEVLPRLNDASYDVALFDAQSPQLASYLMHALRLVKPGGMVLAYHPLRGGKLAAPTARDEQTGKIRELLASLPDLNVQWNLLAVGTGLLQIIKR
ncbi:MAG: class I SAM-dependent methyltransferase [Microbacteriaceae bacterium]